MHIERKQSIVHTHGGTESFPVPLHQAGAIRIDGHHSVTSEVRARRDFHRPQFLLGHATCTTATVLSLGE